MGVRKVLFSRILNEKAQYRGEYGKRGDLITAIKKCQLAKIDTFISYNQIRHHSIYMSMVLTFF